MSNENTQQNSIIDWYNDNSIQVATGVNPPTVADLNPVPAVSPQADIQQDIINKTAGAQLTMKNDNLIAVDKMNAYKAFGLLKIIEDKLKLFDYYAGAQVEDPIKKEGLANDLKSLSRELADIVGTL